MAKGEALPPLDMLKLALISAPAVIPGLILLSIGRVIFTPAALAATPPLVAGFAVLAEVLVVILPWGIALTHEFAMYEKLRSEGKSLQFGLWSFDFVIGAVKGFVFLETLVIFVYVLLASIAFPAFLWSNMTPAGLLSMQAGLAPLIPALQALNSFVVASAAFYMIAIVALVAEWRRPTTINGWGDLYQSLLKTYHDFIPEPKRSAPTTTQWQGGGAQGAPHAQAAMPPQGSGPPAGAQGSGQERQGA